MPPDLAGKRRITRRLYVLDPHPRTENVAHDTLTAAEDRSGFRVLKPPAAGASPAQIRALPKLLHAVAAKGWNWGRICSYVYVVPMFRMRDAAQLLGVSDDTLRRWADGGKLAVTRDEGGLMAIDGAELARFAEEQAAASPQLTPRPIGRESARNRFVGLVTRLIRDTVMAQVEMQSGPNRIVSLMSREAADELGLEPGVLAVASVKSTHVVVEVPSQ